MAEAIGTIGGRRTSTWRIAGWGAAVLLLAAPLVAMRLHAEGVNWSLGDFVVMGAMLGAVGGLIEFAVRMSPNRWYRTGVGVAVLGAFLMAWANLAVGIVGSEHNPNNQLFFVALLIALAGAIGARFRADGMARTMLATAIAVVIAFTLAELGQRDEPVVRPLVEAVGTSIFVMLFLGSAWLFRRAAAEETQPR